MHNTTIITNFPDWDLPGFDLNKYNSLFTKSNVVINALSRNIDYPKHWGPLSIKCSFKGSEYYETDKCRFKVDEKNFLILNNGSFYNSYIDSDSSVESFTVCFSPCFVSEAIGSLVYSNEKLLTDYTMSYPQEVNFIEKLYEHNSDITPKLAELRTIIKNRERNPGCINEKLYSLLEAILLENRKVYSEIGKLNKLRLSTRIEIYKRLSTAKDYIRSNFQNKVSLDDIAKVSCMCRHHLLREFKKFFKLTPHQYLTQIRLSEAELYLIHTRKPITEIALSIGFEYLSSFSKLFMKKYSLSPEKYRKKHSV